MTIEKELELETSFCHSVQVGKKKRKGYEERRLHRGEWQAQLQCAEPWSPISFSFVRAFWGFSSGGKCSLLPTNLLASKEQEVKQQEKTRQLAKQAEAA